MLAVTNLLSSEALLALKSHASVLAAKALLDARPRGVQYFSVPTSDQLRDAFRSRFDLTVGDSVPMRWIKGDTPPHKDAASSNFEHTYLVYLNDSPGELVLGDATYPIQTNSAFKFQEGILHETRNTGDVARLLIGPMNEFAEPVGAAITFFATYDDAVNGNYGALLGTTQLYVVDYSGASEESMTWRIAPNSSGSSSQSVVYRIGDTLLSDGTYNMYPSAPCFLEGSTVLCEVGGVETYVPVEQLERGTLVKTSMDGYKPVVLVGKGAIQNPANDDRTENRLYKCTPDKYPALTEDLYITGCHSILEFPITEKQREDTIKHLGKLYVTDKKYRLMACVDERAEPWNSAGTYPIWHFALQHSDEGMNYGVYANGGLLVETCSIRFLKKSTLALV
jgi:hypothetical protein